MQTRFVRWLAVTALANLTLYTALWAGNPAPTMITVPDMVCQGCAKRVTTQLNQVAGVATVKSDPEAKIATVVPKAEAILSPRALWEAVQKAGKHPSRLEGPSGTFTAKPQS
jgi:Cu+-exporting ATPase